MYGDIFIYVTNCRVKAMDIGFIRCGLLIFAALALLHLIFTFRDLSTPKYFRPRDKTLLDRMQNTQISLAKNPKNFWMSYLGFNFSHCVGILGFVFLFWILSVIAPDIIFHPAFTTILIGTGVTYSVLSYKFWFSRPFIGSVIGTGLLILGTLIHFIK